MNVTRKGSTGGAHGVLAPPPSTPPNMGVLPHIVFPLKMGSQHDRFLGEYFGQRQLLRDRTGPDRLGLEPVWVRIGFGPDRFWTGSVLKF